MEGLVARKVLSGALANAFKTSDGEAVAKKPKQPADEDKSTYKSEPSWLDRFGCFLSGLAYTRGSYIDANGVCQVKGETKQQWHGR